MAKVRVRIHGTVRDKAVHAMGFRAFKQCCQYLAENADEGEQHGRSPLWHQDFEFGSGARHRYFRFWFVYNPPVDRTIRIVAIESYTEWRAATVAVKLVKLAIKLAGYL